MKIEVGKYYVLKEQINPHFPRGGIILCDQYEEDCHSFTNIATGYRHGYIDSDLLAPYIQNGYLEPAVYQLQSNDEELNGTLCRRYINIEGNGYIYRTLENNYRLSFSSKSFLNVLKLSDGIFKEKTKKYKFVVTKDGKNYKRGQIVASTVDCSASCDFLVSYKENDALDSAVYEVSLVGSHGGELVRIVKPLFTRYTGNDIRCVENTESGNRFEVERLRLRKLSDTVVEAGEMGIKEEKISFPDVNHDLYHPCSKQDNDKRDCCTLEDALKVNKDNFLPTGVKIEKTPFSGYKYPVKKIITWIASFQLPSGEIVKVPKPDLKIFKKIRTERPKEFFIVSSIVKGILKVEAPKDIHLQFWFNDFFQLVWLKDFGPILENKEARLLEYSEYEAYKLLGEKPKEYYQKKFELL